MIFGIGVDMVRVDRLTASKDLSVFAKKILGPSELKTYNDLPASKTTKFLASQFAAKEAFVKAIQTGFKNPIYPNRIEVLRDQNGAPFFKLETSVKKELTKLGICNAHVSLSDEKEYALAFVVLEK